MTNPAYVEFRAQRKSRRGRFFVLIILGIGLAILLATGIYKTQSPQAEGTHINGVPTRAPSTTRPILRVGTFNIQSGHGKDHRLDLDRTTSCILGCDLLGLNEVPNPAMTQTLAEKAGLAWLFAPSEHRWWRDRWGNALLTDLPVKQWIRFPMNRTKPSGFRSLLLSRQEFHGQIISVLITHLDGTDDREAQLRVVTSLFQSLQPPAILMGDFNTHPDDAQLKALAATPGVVDALANIDTKHATGHIDWIFVKGFNVLDAGVMDNGASDHPFYWADLELK